MLASKSSPIRKRVDPAGEAGRWAFGLARVACAPEQLRLLGGDFGRRAVAAALPGVRFQAQFEGTSNVSSFRLSKDGQSGKASRGGDLDVCGRRKQPMPIWARDDSRRRLSSRGG